MIPLLILQLATATPPPRPPLSGRNVVALFSADDYLAEAMQNGWEGVVVADIRVDAAGRPRSCRVVRSSGHQILDVKTCEIMLVRARFAPARDAAGRPTADVVRTPPISWRIEQEPAPDLLPDPQ